MEQFPNLSSRNLVCQWSAGLTVKLSQFVSAPGTLPQPRVAAGLNTRSASLSNAFKGRHPTGRSSPPPSSSPWWSYLTPGQGEFHSHSLKVFDQRALNTFEKLHFCQTGAVTNWNMKTVNKGSVSAIWWCSKALPPLPGNQTTRSVWHGVPALLSTVNNRCWHFKLTFNSSEPAHYFWLVGYTEKTNNKSGRHNFHISHWKQSMEKSLENDDPWNYLTPWGFLLISYEVHMCCEALERNTKHLYSSVL